MYMIKLCRKKIASMIFELVNFKFFKIEFQIKSLETFVVVSIFYFNYLVFTMYSAINTKLYSLYQKYQMFTSFN